jgi:hypothetical protein
LAIPSFFERWLLAIVDSYSSNRLLRTRATLAIVRATFMSHPDLNQLLDSLLPHAERMLAERGEFSPFGGAMNQAGELMAVSGYDVRAHPPSQNVIELMTQTLRQRARSGQLRAVGICYDGRKTPPGQTEKCDAVCASVEHQSGEAVNLILPYERTSKGEVQFGQKFSTLRVPQFFVSNERTVGGWLLMLCFILVVSYPARSAFTTFSPTPFPTSSTRAFRFVQSCCYASTPFFSFLRQSLALLRV